MAILLAALAAQGEVGHPQHRPDRAARLRAHRRAPPGPRRGDPAGRVIASALRESPPAGPPDDIPRLELSEWGSRYGLVAGITTARDGFSLELSSGAPVGASIDRWRAFQAHFRPRLPAVAFSRQVHGTQVRHYQSVPDGWLIGEGWDGHATASAGILLTISVADCIPVYLADPGSGGVALVHAGWRGTVGGVLGAGAKALCRGDEVFGLRICNTLWHRHLQYVLMK